MFLGTFIDIAIVLLIFLAVRYGYQKGGVGLLSRPIAAIICPIVALSYSATVGNTVVSPLIAPTVEGYLKSQLFGEALSGSTVDIPVMNLLSELTESAKSSITDHITRAIATVIAFFVLIFVLRIVFSFVRALADILFARGPLGVVNRIFGGVIAASIAFAIIGIICRLSYRSSVIDQLDNSFGGYLYRLFALGNYVPD